MSDLHRRVGGSSLLDVDCPCRVALRGVANTLLPVTRSINNRRLRRRSHQRLSRGTSIVSLCAASATIISREHHKKSTHVIPVLIDAQDSSDHGNVLRVGPVGYVIESKDLGAGWGVSRLISMEAIHGKENRNEGCRLLSVGPRLWFASSEAHRTYRSRLPLQSVERVFLQSIQDQLNIWTQPNSFSMGRDDNCVLK